jgi:UDP-N-acetylglucosamine 2-epimerase (non-hydrolysing)/GDP/UDP-N,N'-diacetylbacillosamine 2-epimerase (hydrolysing)
MAKTLGLAVLGLTDTLAQMRPDLLLLIADRYEMLAPASVALTLRIPVAHIEGGEISEGAIDDQVRNALTKLAHLHFTSTPTARARVLALGEEPWRVLRAGAPSLDHLRRSTLLTRPQLEAALNLPLANNITVVAYHPVTLLADTTAEADAVFTALTEHAQTDTQILFCYPNADAGSHALMTRVRAFCAEHANAHLFVNLPAITYWSLLREATLLLGNSSSGIMEAASFALPVVNIGLRQHGRERAPNILDSPDPNASPDPGIAEASGASTPTAADILAKIALAQSPTFRASLRTLENPYGDGHAAERIVSRILEVLTTTPVDTLLRKRAQPLPHLENQIVPIELSS